MRVVKGERSLTVYRVTTGKRRVSVHAEFVPHRGPMGGWTAGIWKDRINYLHVQGGLSLGPIHLYAQWRHRKPSAPSLPPEEQP